MSAGYTWVQWNRHKRVYDAILVGAIAAYLGVFLGVGSLAWTGVHAIGPEVLLIRALGSCAIVLLHVVLCIGPLARLDRRFLPLLYNRRHLGVTTFVLALGHGVVATGYYHGFGVDNPLVSLLSSGTWLGWGGGAAGVRGFPFELLGVVALLVLFLMAATSHDFWLKNLSPRVWKGLHMLVYGAYALLIGHVALGALQADRGVAGPALVGAGLALVTVLHVAAAVREVRRDDASAPAAEPSAMDAAPWLRAVDRGPCGGDGGVGGVEGDRAAAGGGGGRAAAMRGGKGPLRTRRIRGGEARTIALPVRWPSG